MIQSKSHRSFHLIVLILFSVSFSTTVSAGFLDHLKAKLEEKKAEIKEKTDKAIREAKNKISPDSEEGKKKSKDKEQNQAATNHPEPAAKARPAPEVARKVQQAPAQAVVQESAKPAAQAKPVATTKLSKLDYLITGFGKDASILGVKIGMKPKVAVKN
jgi:hypothetical protein